MKIRNKKIIAVLVFFFLLGFGIIFFSFLHAAVLSSCSGIYFSRNLSSGSSGSDVKCLQAILGFPIASQSGIFDSVTDQALIKFQSQNSYYDEVGFIGPKMRAILNARINARPPVPKPVPASTPTPTQNPVSPVTVKIPTQQECAVSTFTKYLYQTVTDSQVLCLQMLLNKDPATQVSAIGLGSPGKETIYFGLRTKQAVVKFQQKHSVSAIGIVGPQTRAKLNSLLVPPVSSSSLSSSSSSSSRSSSSSSSASCSSSSSSSSSSFFSSLYSSSPSSSSSSAPVCGNGVCENGETNQICWQDCPAVCGNGKCETWENYTNCPQDCPSNGFIFGSWADPIGFPGFDISSFDDYAAVGINYFGVGLWKGYDPQLLASQLAQLKSKGYKLALQISPGYLDGEILNGNDDSKYLNSSCLTSSCYNFHTGHQINPAYEGSLWKNTLSDIGAFTSAVNPDGFLIDMEFGWMSNPYKVEDYFTNPGWVGCSCPLIKNTLGYDGYGKAFKSRVKEIDDVARSLKPNAQINWFLENGVQDKSWDIDYDGTYMLNDFGDAPQGAGTTASPGLYDLPNLELFQKNADAGYFNRSLPWVSPMTIAGYSGVRDDYKTLPVDLSVSREAGRIMRKGGADGLLFWPSVDGCQNKMTFGEGFSVNENGRQYCLDHIKAMIDGFNEGETYVEQNKISNPSFESFKTPNLEITTTTPATWIAHLVPVYWSWTDSSNYPDDKDHATLNYDKQYGLYSWKHTRDGQLGQRTILSKEFSISSADAGNYDFSIYTKASLASQDGQIFFSLANSADSSEISLGKAAFAIDWGATTKNLNIPQGTYKLKILINDNTAQKVDILLDNVSLQKAGSFSLASLFSAVSGFLNLIWEKIIN